MKRLEVCLLVGAPLIAASALLLPLTPWGRQSVWVALVMVAVAVLLRLISLLPVSPSPSWPRGQSRPDVDLAALDPESRRLLHLFSSFRRTRWLQARDISAALGNLVAARQSRLGLDDADEGLSAPLVRFLRRDRSSRSIDDLPSDEVLASWLREIRT